MIRRPKLLAASAIATLALAGGVPIAAAKAGGHHKSVHRLVVKAAASYLGLSRKELRAQSHGTSLAQLATAQGKSVDGLRQAMYGAVKVKLDQRVAAGKLSAEKEQAKLVRIQAWISKLVAKIRK